MISVKGETMSKKGISLSEYFNHKVFKEGSDQQKNGRIGICEGTLEKLDVECEKEIFVLEDGKFDNIQCNKVVSVPIGISCKIVHILCFAEWEEFSEKVAFTYSDGNVIKKRCIIPEYSYYWKYKDTYYNGIWKNSWNAGRILQPYLRTRRSDGEEGHLYDIPFDVSEIEGEIECITLPRNEFLHVFAITCET